MQYSGMQCKAVLYNATHVCTFATRRASVDSGIVMQHNMHNANGGKKSEVDLAARNFLEFLAEGRQVILEDAALLQDEYPQHRLFNLPCFKMPADGSLGTPLQQKWAAFKAEVIAAHARSIDQNLEVSMQHLVMGTADIRSANNVLVHTQYFFCGS